MLPVKKGGASSMRRLINHISSHMNTLQALSLNVPIQDLMLNHLMPATLDTVTQREWELIMASCTDTPTAELVTFLELCRISHILGIKVQNLGETSDYPVTEVTCYHSMFITVNWRQGQ